MLFVIIGAPAVGKTTTSRAVAQGFDRGIHIPVDDLRDMVIAGQAQPDSEVWGDELIAQIQMARESAIAMAERYRAAGFVAVIDDFLDPLLLDEYRPLEGRDDVVTVILRPAEQAARDRNRLRAESDEERGYIDAGIGVVFRLLDAHGSDLEERGWKMIDNTDRSITETASAIVDLRSSP